jgi:hypothetical protein
VAQFDDLFAFAVRAARLEPQRLDVVLRRIVEAPARDLARRDSECCSFLTFDFEPAGNEVMMHIAVPPEHVAVLDALDRQHDPHRELGATLPASVHGCTPYAVADRGRFAARSSWNSRWLTLSPCG